MRSSSLARRFDITTDYGPLQAEGRTMLATRLQEVGLNVGKGAASAVKDPGATAKGMAGGVSSTATVGNLVWSQDPEALLKGNQQKLAELGVKPETIKKLYSSKGFSLSLHTRLAAALRAVNVPGCADYVETAADADTEREAVFFVESAEMLARFHEAESVTALLPDSRGAVAKTKDGRAVVLLPVDWVGWTQPYDKALGEVTQRSKSELKATALELRTSATLSAAAKQDTSARGWKVDKVPAS